MVALIAYSQCPSSQKIDWQPSLFQFYSSNPSILSYIGHHRHLLFKHVVFFSFSCLLYLNGHTHCCECDWVTVTFISHHHDNKDWIGHSNTIISLPWCGWSSWSFMLSYLARSFSFLLFISIIYLFILWLLNYLFMLCQPNLFLMTEKTG